MCTRVYTVYVDGRGNIIVMHLAKLVSNVLCFRMLKNNSLGDVHEYYLYVLHDDGSHRMGG